MRSNMRAARAYSDHMTHEGAPAKRIDAEAALRRSVMSCLLWESEFYESGEDIAERIVGLVPHVAPETLLSIAGEARNRMHLRHVPLLIVSAMAKAGIRGGVLASAVDAVVERADELSELLAVHARVNKVTPDKVKKTIPAAMKRGLASAFGKFDAYQLAKYDRANAVRLRDVLFLCHAKPADEAQAAVWRDLVAGALPVPDTWEVALSGGADKREAFTRLLTENKLGYLALLRNLRNMVEAGVDRDLIREKIIARNGAHRVLPFRYVAAARACPQLEPEIDTALCEAVATSPPLPGSTVVLVDVSGSMGHRISARSDMTRLDAAAALASVIHGDLRVFTFSDRTLEVPPRRGMAGVDVIQKSQPHGGTDLGKAISVANMLPHDRLIVITDEQSHTRVGDPRAKKAYMINVASAKNGVGYGRWTHIDGWSEGALRYIREIERLDG